MAVFVTKSNVYVNEPTNIRIHIFSSAFVHSVCCRFPIVLWLPI